ncbi:hypothetical protein [Mesorhizobium escarrei]|uniref:Cytochrome c domain-containing protein n=1 Tax=Mesorhizobium escarrei TaxID=666018 RepID=A0ABM9EBS9_9HYPH|nr:hypothetical protein [Mesorhizobium escarrei]CAH2406756.1 hypothetical protein MES5069_530105 [Mesorhizobium escarrei]
MLDRRGKVQLEVPVLRKPVIALAATPDANHLAVAGIVDGILLLDAMSLSTIRTLDTSGVAVWSLAFAAGGKTLLAGGADHLVREWNIETGERLGAAATGRTDPMARYAGNPDAEAFRACIACHTLDPNDGNRAWPTLNGIFGRKIASVPISSCQSRGFAISHKPPRLRHPRAERREAERRPWDDEVEEWFGQS